MRSQGGNRSDLRAEDCPVSFLMAASVSSGIANVLFKAIAGFLPRWRRPLWLIWMSRRSLQTETAGLKPSWPATFVPGAEGWQALHLMQAKRRSEYGLQIGFRQHGFDRSLRDNAASMQQNQMVRIAGREVQIMQDRHDGNRR